MLGRLSSAGLAVAAVTVALTAAPGAARASEGCYWPYVDFMAADPGGLATTKKATTTSGRLTRATRGQSSMRSTRACTANGCGPGLFALGRNAPGRRSAARSPTATPQFWSDSPARDVTIAVMWRRGEQVAGVARREPVLARARVFRRRHRRTLITRARARGDLSPALLDPYVVLRVVRGAVPPGRLAGDPRCGGGGRAGAHLRAARSACAAGARERCGRVRGGPQSGRPASVAGFTVTHGKIVKIDLLADSTRPRRL
jgi:hypothetical protein